MDLQELLRQVKELIKLPAPRCSSTDPTYFAGSFNDGWALVSNWSYWVRPYECVSMTPYVTVGDPRYGSKNEVQEAIRQMALCAYPDEMIAPYK